MKNNRRVAARETSAKQFEAAKNVVKNVVEQPHSLLEAVRNRLHQKVVNSEVLDAGNWLDVAERLQQLTKP